MADSVYEVLKSTHPKLVADVLDKNEEISKFLMLIYAHTLYTAMDRPEDPKDMYFHCSIENGQNGDFLKIDIKYVEADDKPAIRGRLEGKNPIKRNLDLVTLLQSNSNIRDVALRVVELLERWVAEKPHRKQLGLSHVVLHDQMFWKNLIFTADILLKVQWEELVKTKANFPDDEELAAEHPMVNGGFLV